MWTPRILICRIGRLVGDGFGLSSSVTSGPPRCDPPSLSDAPFAVRTQKIYFVFSLPLVADHISSGSGDMGRPLFDEGACALAR